MVKHQAEEVEVVVKLERWGLQLRCQTFTHQETTSTHNSTDCNYRHATVRRRRWCTQLNTSDHRWTSAAASSPSERDLRHSLEREETDSAFAFPLGAHVDAHHDKCLTFSLSGAALRRVGGEERSGNI